jgi:hypothetical protein
VEKAITSLTAEVKKAGQDMNNAQRDHVDAKGQYEKNANDLKEALKSLQVALKTMRSSDTKLVQIESVGKTVRQAVLLADALGLSGSQQAASMFLQDAAPKVEMENFKFHSDGIIKTLEKVNDDFRKQAHQLDKDETKRKKGFMEFMQMKSDEVKQKTRQIEAVKQVAKMDKTSELAKDREELGTTSKMLADDKAYLDELNGMCKAKAKSYDQRQKNQGQRTDLADSGLGHHVANCPRKDDCAHHSFCSDSGICAYRRCCRQQRRCYGGH